MSGVLPLGAGFVFAATAVFIVLLIPLARRLGLVDHPDHRKTHSAPTPAIGGVAMVFAIAPIGLWLVPATPQLEGIALAGLVIVAAGVVDDFHRLGWRARLLAQVLAAVLLIQVGHIRIDSIGETFGVPTRPLGPIAAPLSILATVGIINAVNMLDGVDGLAGASTLASITMIAAAAAYSGNVQLAQGLVLIAAGLCAFLLFNLRSPWNPRARVFLGNAGSEFLGLIMACACFRLTQNHHHPVGIQVAPFLMAPALLDCLTMVLRRVRLGQSPFVADRNHLHHLLLDAGMSPSRVVLMITGMTWIIGAAAGVALKLHVPAVAFTVSFVLLFSAHFLLTAKRVRSLLGPSKAFGRAWPSFDWRWPGAARAEGEVRRAPV